jgi:hypothetical protein
VDRYCRAKARLDVLEPYFFQMAQERDIESIPITVISELNREDAMALRCAHELGLTPAAQAERIGRAARRRAGVSSSAYKLLTAGPRRLAPSSMHPA